MSILNHRRMNPALKRVSRLRFSLAHVGLYSAGIAITLSLAPHSFVFASAVAPLLLGPVLGHAVSSDKAGILLGGVSAVFWSFFFSYGPMVIVAFSMLTVGESGDAMLIGGVFSPLEAIVLFGNLTASTIGGFVGGRVAIH